MNLPQILDGENKSSPFINCLRNHYRHARKWAKRTNTDCFRIYDREIVGYPCSIDFYNGHYCIHYFERSSGGNPPSEELVKEVAASLDTLLGASSDKIHWRTRKKSKETRQYEKIGNAKRFFTVTEYGIKFKINLSDYLDTGLFLDHRETRRLVSRMSPGKRVLNLFSYTASFSVHAAVGGAAFTKSVDMSNTYSAWAKDNFLLNRISLENNEIIRADCLKFLDKEIRTGVTYDIVVIDPPTVSRSKKMDGLFDIQADYLSLISKSLQLLANDGTIFFSTNSVKFRFDDTAFPDCTITEISDKTIPFDFRNKKIHSCRKIQIKKQRNNENSSISKRARKVTEK